MGNKIIAVGPHYKSSMKQRGLTDIHPLKLFMKPFSSIITKENQIVLKSFMNEVVAEAEIALKLKKDIKNANESDINLTEILEGITIGLDVTLLDEHAFSNGKIYDTFTPLGNFNNINPYEVNFEVFLNGELKQQANEMDLGLRFEEIIAYCSNYFTLNKGDIILAGTPAGTFKINHGDMIEIKSNLFQNIQFIVGGK